MTISNLFLESYSVQRFNEKRTITTFNLLERITDGLLREAITEEKQLFCGHLPQGGGGSDQFRTFWGDFGMGMCVEITNILIWC